MTNAIALCPWKLPVLLSLLLLVPGVSLAAEEPSLNPPPLPGAAPREPLHLVEEPPKAEPVRSIHPVVRVVSELGAELVTGVLAGLPGAYAGIAICDKFKLSPPGSFLPCTEYAGYGFLTAVSLAAPLGVWWGGKLADGHGTLLGAYLGMGAAAVLGLGATVLVYNDDIQPFVIPLFSLVGAFVGYEVSHHSETSARDTSVASVQPLFSVSAKGGALGLGGRF